MDDIHQELAGGVKRLPGITFARWNLPVIRLALRLTTARVDPGDVTVEIRNTGELPVRVYTPKAGNPGGALMWIHGGGMVVGTPKMDDDRCVAFARELGVVVVSPDYRLAPRHRYPAALDDCYAAWRWTTRLAESLGVDLSRIAIGGGSAGGGLAASVTHRIRDDGGAPPCAQLLVYPMLDDRSATDGEDSIRHMVWNRSSNRTGWSSYLGQPPGADAVPRYAVPARRDDLSGLPPAWIGVGTLDLFIDENREYAKRLENAGVRCRIEVVKGAFHGFETLIPDSPVSVAFVRAQIEFLREHLSPSSGSARREDA